jgi:Glycogen recognition site of AMP-activated protein kinase
MEHLASLFIDDEMSMDDKIAFVHQIKNEPAAADNTLQLLEQEILIREDVVTHIPHSTFPLTTETPWEKVRSFVMQPKWLVTASLAGTLAALAVLVLVLSTPQTTLQPSRFVIYRPDVTRAEITGSFTDWQKVPMQAIGSSGYWEIVLALPKGEHHFSYILNGQDSYPDPTILTREQDDFGGQNSVIFVGDMV